MGTREVGFALVTYKDTAQAVDLIDLLNRMFDHPPISLHHDLRLSSFDISALSPNVQHIPERFRTGWGTLETVLAMWKTIDHLMNRPDAPEWFYLITGHCYPIKTAAQMLKGLRESPYDLYLKQSAVFPVESPQPWDIEMQSRYVNPQIRVPFIARNGRIMHKYVILPQKWAKHPFSAEFPCRSGATYYSGNRRAYETLRRGFADRKLVRWFEGRPIIDEGRRRRFWGTIRS